MYKMTTDITKCIHCHKCRDSCAFLKKYNIDIGDGKELRELAFHCFLCGTCTSVCPENIDGRKVIQDLRRELVSSGRADLTARGYRTMLWEKKNYKFRNYRHAGEGAVLFPGCNFPSLYPKTTALLSRILKETAGIGTVYDCCGKPVAELGLEDEENRITDEISRKLKDCGVKEVITVCPNCFSYLREKLDIPVVSIYEKLHELGLGKRIPGGERVFMPCPDRGSGAILSQIEEYFADEPYRRISGMQCCGLGASAGVCEPELAGSMTEDLRNEPGIRVYCASCAGKLKRSGVPGIRHILSEILGTDEEPDTGKSAINRALTGFK